MAKAEGREKLRRRWLLVIFGGLLPIAFDLGFFTAGLLPDPRTSDEVAHADLVVVLTGGQGRLREAIQLLVNGKGKYLLVSGTDPKAQLLTILKANRIPELPDDVHDRILLDDESRTTNENAIEIRKTAEQLRAKSLLLVTSNYHVRRAMHFVEQEFRREPAYPVQVMAFPVESPNFARGTWWHHPTGWYVLLQEYFKSLPSRWGLPIFGRGL